MIDYTTVLDKASELIFVFDKEGKVTYLNKISLEELEYTVDSVNVRDIIPNVFDEESDIFAFAAGNNQSIDTDAYRKNHTCFPVRIHFSSDNENYCVCYMTDMRENVSMQKQINNFEDHVHEIIKAKDEFTANLTHELRTPVNGIKGHIRNLKEEEDDTSKKRKMDIVLKCCENMETIINNLLDFAKLENGKMIIESEPFNLHELIESSISIIGSVANEKGVILNYHIDDKVPGSVIGDEFHLSQVINNLLNNAIKFTSIGSVELEVFKTKQQGKDMELTFFVRDTGIGMSVDEMDKLFQSFTQVDGSITRTYGGTGLGLYVCKQIVELMGGNIEVQSEKGKGSTFIFTVKMQSQFICEGEEAVVTIEDLKKDFMQSSSDSSITDEITFNDLDNLERLRDLIEKTTLCVELDNWDRAEGFSGVIKKLAETGPEDFSKNAFRLVMNVRKEKKDNCRKYLSKLSDYIEDTLKSFN
ncbi:MAG: hypothetical protein K5644_02810 [Lachnospiraceae bacterium]|nr:hypothetical protein [Lachnospiraceae bacterium]